VTILLYGLVALAGIVVVLVGVVALLWGLQFVLRQAEERR
jgi:protein-S-isoprenylcysteine O-methyltransferase Ste14